MVGGGGGIKEVREGGGRHEREKVDDEVEMKGCRVGERERKKIDKLKDLV